MSPDTFNLQNRGTIGKSVGKLRVNDAMSDFLVCRAHDHVLYFRYRFGLTFCHLAIAMNCLNKNLYVCKAYPFLGTLQQVVPKRKFL